jgi:hypothetical protein
MAAAVTDHLTDVRKCSEFVAGVGRRAELEP